MFSAEVLIPKTRIAVVIGKKGVTKRALEKYTKTTLKVGKEGDVFIIGEDNLDVFITTSIVKAIGRGFNPEIARLLLNDDYTFEIINIKDFTKRSERKFERIKARLIGTKGGARHNIEKNTDTNISIFGKTVAIIGKYENVMLAKNSLEKLLKGSPHGNVYKYISDYKKRFR